MPGRRIGGRPDGCLQDAAYSSYFKFTSDRVIARDDLIFGNGFEDLVS